MFTNKLLRMILFLKMHMTLICPALKPYLRLEQHFFLKLALPVWLDEILKISLTVRSVRTNTIGSTQWQVTASQAVFNYQAWAKVQQAKASVKAAQATFNDAAQNLILRAAKAYFDVLLAKDTLDFAEAKKRANKRQLDQATQRFQVGLDAITSVYEAKAAYDQSIATVIPLAITRKIKVKT